MTTETTSLRLDADIKSAAYAVFKEIGMKPTQAFNLFLYQVVLNKGIPFDVRIPNTQSFQAMKETDNRQNLKSYNNAQTMLDDILSEDN